MKYFFYLLLMLPVLSLPAQKIVLFNGEDLSGWNIHGTEKWYVEDGELVLGQWQSVMLVELDGPRSRRVAVRVMGE